MKNLLENQIENFATDKEVFFAKKMSEVFTSYSELENLKNALIATANEALSGISLNSSYDAESKAEKITKVVAVLDFATKLNIENDLGYLDDFKNESEKKKL